ncbi:hypothetical protein [Undibacterium aquatile]|uniref:Uncharacterized protein n=1 Tax=Undibacterium aquatile TaxID=1537398 RepID=A0ABR6XGL4_9BURK|nr:hypothetical protein [Undibacterium aquatile]MBC3812042.1 hypothetical protein [Undibacterium aquatile]
MTAQGQQAEAKKDAKYRGSTLEGDRGYFIQPGQFEQGGCHEWRHKYAKNGHSLEIHNQEK